MNREQNWHQLFDVWTYYVIHLCCFQNNQSSIIWPPPKLPQEELLFQLKSRQFAWSPFSLHMQSSNRLRPEVLAETGSRHFLSWWGSESSWTPSSGSCDECLHLPCNYLPFSPSHPLTIPAFITLRCRVPSTCLDGLRVTGLCWLSEIHS